MQNVVAQRRIWNPSQPVPREPISPASPGRLRRVGEIRLPLGGPYRPRARLYLLPDGRRLWRVRLWEYDRPVVHLLPTAVLREFARRNGLRQLERDLEDLLARTVPERSP